jgi:CBS domain-containing protein/ribosome-associated translation inhibitor RaiA
LAPRLGNEILADHGKTKQEVINVNGTLTASSRVDRNRMQLREIMSTRVVTIGPEEAASEAWTRLRRGRIRHLVVMDAKRLVGVLSERDLGGRAGAAARKGRRVQDTMTPHVASATPETTVREAADLMRKRLIGSLPVLDGDRLVGIVTATDVFDALGSAAIKTLSRAERQLLRAPSSSKRLGGQPVPDRRSGAKGMPNEHWAAMGNKKRVPFADRIPRALKRKVERMDASRIPANIRLAGINLDHDDRAYIRQTLGKKLGKYAAFIERVSVRVEDVNGPRGGVDRVCRIKVVLSGLPSIVVQSQAASLNVAIDGALAGAERAVRRGVQRKRRKPTGRGGERTSAG